MTATPHTDRCASCGCYLAPPNPEDPDDTGMLCCMCFDPPDRAAYLRRLRSLRPQPSWVRIRTVGTPGLAPGPVAAEQLVLPLGP